MSLSQPPQCPALRLNTTPRLEQATLSLGGLQMKRAKISRLWQQSPALPAKPDTHVAKRSRKAPLGKEAFE